MRGRRVAISRKRSSYGRDVVDQLLYRDLTRGVVRSAASFFKAASQTPQTFNSFYVDHSDIAMYTSGRLPLRAKGVDSGLPTDGRGRHEWRGFLSAKAHPQGRNPRGGVLNNWNNKPALGFPGADDQFAYGSEQRVDLLNAGISEARRSTPSPSVTGAMNAAATQDVRSVVFQPVLSEVLRRRPCSQRQGAPDARPARGVARRTAAAAWTATSTARSTIRAPRSWTRPGTGSPTPG